MSLNQQSTALPAIGLYSALIPLLGVNFDKPVTVGFSAAEVAADTFRILGTLDSTATDDTNATELGTVAGLTGLNLPPDLVAKLSGWPYIFVQRLTGTNAGSLFVTGEVSSAATAVATATPAASAFSAVLDLTAFGADPVRIGGSAGMLAGDTFDVYVTQIVGATSAAGCYKAGRITGGGSDNGKVNSLLLSGWPYALVQRASTGTATAGTIIACGVSPASGNAPDSVAPLPNTDVRRGATGEAFAVFFVPANNGATVAAAAQAARIRMTADAEVVVGFRNALNTANVALLSKDGANGGTIGDATAFVTLGITVLGGVNPIIATLGAAATGRAQMLLRNNTVGGSRGTNFVMGTAVDTWSISTDPAGAGVQLFAISDDAAGARRFQINAAGGVSLTATPADPSALLDLSANLTLGLGLTRPPRATITALANPLKGLTMYDVTNDLVVVNVGTPGAPNYRKAAGGPWVRAVNTNAQAVADGAAAAAMITWTETTDQTSNFVAGTGVFTAPVAGFYLFSVAAEFAAAAAVLAAEFRLGIYVGGALQAEGVYTNPVAALNVSRQVQVTHALELAAGDTVDFRVFQNSGGAIALTATAAHNYLSISLLN